MPHSLLAPGLIIACACPAFAEPIVRADAPATPKVTTLSDRIQPAAHSRGWLPGDQGVGARAGGDSPGSAVVLAGVNVLTGNNALNTDFGDEICPDTVTGPGGGLDQWYAYTNGSITRTIAVSACDPGTNFDTKLYAYEGGFVPGSPIVCDDDTCSGGLGNPWVSEIIHVAAPSETYLYAVDAWSSGDVGNYVIHFEDDYIVDPCVVTCDGAIVNSGECVPGGDGDEGCNSPMQDEFFPINCGETVCGEFFTDSASGTRDLDWYELTLTDTNDVTFLLASENLEGHGIVIIDVADVGGCNPPGMPQPVSYTATAGEACVTTGVIVTGLAPGDYWVVVYLIGDDASLDCPNSQTYNVSIECDCTNYLRSDVDRSGMVNFDDLNLILLDWGAQCGQ